MTLTDFEVPAFGPLTRADELAAVEGVLEHGGDPIRRQVVDLWALERLPVRIARPIRRAAPRPVRPVPTAGQIRRRATGRRPQGRTSVVAATAPTRGPSAPVWALSRKERSGMT